MLNFPFCKFHFFPFDCGVKCDQATLKRFSAYQNKRSSHTASSRIFRRMSDHALPVCPLTSSLQLRYSKNDNHCLGQRVEFPSPARRLIGSSQNAGFLMWAAVSSYI